MKHIKKENLRDSEIKERFSKDGYEGLFEVTKDYLEKAMEVGKKPISVTVCVETNESCFFSQKINRAKLEDHIPDRVVEAVKSGVLSEDGESPKKMGDLERNLAEMNGMSKLALFISEYTEKQNVCGMVDGKKLLETIAEFTKKEMKERFNEKVIEKLVKDAVEDILGDE